MSMKELLEALDAGQVLEVFGAGTACVVCPVGSLLYKGKVGLVLQRTLASSSLSQRRK